MLMSGEGRTGKREQDIICGIYVKQIEDVSGDIIVGMKLPKQEREDSTVSCTETYVCKVLRIQAPA